MNMTACAGVSAPRIGGGGSPSTDPPGPPPDAGGAPADPGGFAVPTDDLHVALAHLQEAVDHLAAVVSAMSGAQQVQPETSAGGPELASFTAPERSALDFPGLGSNIQTTGEPDATSGVSLVEPPLADPIDPHPSPVPQMGATDPEAPAQQLDPGFVPAPVPVSEPTLDPMPPTPTTPAGDSAPATSPGVRDRIVQIAREELAKGVREDAGPDSDKAGNIRRYRTAVTGPGEDPDAAEAWCADFASYVFKTAGVPVGQNGQGEDYTVALMNWAKAAGRWHPRGSADPQPGDLVMIDWQGGTDVDHVAVVTKVENGRVYTIGGNENDGVRESSYKVGDQRHVGYITPGEA
jgi:hypothetical protein